MIYLVKLIYSHQTPKDLKAVTFYDWDILKPLREFQIDLKEILDKELALPTP